LQRREPDQALAFARRALEVQPDSGFAALSLSIALQNSGDEAGAEKMLLHTIDLDPSLQAAWINLALLYEHQGRQADRVALLNRYLEWNPQSVWFRQLKNMLSQPH
jgi:tetratricopeptide (TPR) repeat protein